MSLATRCGHCGTIFRVVQDQLKVSEGWVRCGRCGDVFNALQALFDLERESPPPFPGRTREEDREAVPTRHTPLTPAVPDPAPTMRTARPEAVAPSRAETAASAHSDARVDIDEDFGHGDPRGDAARPRALAAPSAAPDVDTATAGAPWAGLGSEPEHRGNLPGPAWHESGAGVGTAPDGPGSLLDTRAEPGFDPTRQDEALTRVDDPIDADRFAAAEARTAEALPGFLRDGPERSPSSPLARAAWTFAALLLAVGLGGQVAVHHRDAVAQSWPWSRPLLGQWCAATGCELLEAPRRIEAFTVETSSLTRKTPTGDVYRFSVTLRNRSGQPAQMPSIDLKLNDASGQLLVRRALSPSDFRVGRPVVAGGADATLQLMMSAAKGQASGYQIELFYP